jgi:hypothetical protein
MTEETTSDQPDALEIFDAHPGTGQLSCRVCGALVAIDGDYPRVHWDWHEAANGA